VTEAAIASAGALQMQTQLDYTREHEREADRVGLTLLERAGFDPRGMATFFERMLRANRLNEFKGAPAYLRTHPLTTERIADMQDRVQKSNPRLVPDSFEYRLTRARLRAASGSPAEAVAYFRNLLADQTWCARARISSASRSRCGARATSMPPGRRSSRCAPRAAGIPLSNSSPRSCSPTRVAPMRRWTCIAPRCAPIRAIARSSMATSTCSWKRAAPRSARGSRGAAGLGAGRCHALGTPARAFSASGRRIAQHRAQAEAYYRRGNLKAAVDQLEIAVRDRRSDFYEISSAESRLRELRALLENEREAEKALKIS